MTAFAQYNQMQSRVEARAVAGLRDRSELSAKGARMRVRAKRCGRGAQGAEQVKGPATALASTRDVLSAACRTIATCSPLHSPV